MRLSSLLGLALLATACAPPAGGGSAALPTAELDAIRAVDAAFAAGMNAGDTAAVFDIYAPGAKLMPPDAPILEGADARSVIAGLIAGGASNFVLTPTTTYGTGDLAYQVGTASFTVGGGAATVKYVEVLRKSADGKWRYVVDMFSGVAPPPAAAPAQ